MPPQSKRTGESPRSAPSGIDWVRRLITAAIAVPTLIASTSLPEPTFSIIVIIAASIGYREMSSLIGYELRMNYVFFILLIRFSLHPLLVFCVGLFNLFFPLVRMGPVHGVRIGLINLFYLHFFGLPTMYGSLLRNLAAHGWTMSLSWILISFSSDAGALITGSLLGSHQCCPAISPKKTWEGLLGAVIGGVGAGAFFFIIGLDASGEVSLNDFLIFGLIAAVFGMIGDLTESGFKRYVSTKDSSDFLPGHGGFLDRLDALGSCAVPIYYYCKWRGW